MGKYLVFLGLLLATLSGCASSSDGSGSNGGDPTSAGGFPPFVPPVQPYRPKAATGLPTQCTNIDTDAYTFEQGWVKCVAGDPPCGFNGYDREAYWPVNLEDAATLCTCDTETKLYACVDTGWTVDGGIPEGLAGATGQ